VSKRVRLESFDGSERRRPPKTGFEQGMKCIDRAGKSSLVWRSQCA
jgi:hypothetical protein